MTVRGKRMMNQRTLASLCKQHNIQKDEWGRLILYKGVTDHFNSVYFPKVGTSPYKPGTLVEMKRIKHRDQWNEIQNCSVGCAPGLNVCSLTEQARCFGSRVVEVRVYPKDILGCNYNLCSLYKIRCRRLYVEKEIPLISIVRTFTL